VHQPFRFKRYRFFEIGNNHYYYDDYSNESILRKIAAKSFLPTNKILLDIIKEYGSRFKVAFSISGTALDQFELYAPDVLESFQKLAQSPSVEFLSETYSHSLASLMNREEFESQVREHDEKIFNLFKKKPTVFRNTELIYDNEIGDWIAEMGFKAVITEGAKHILGWKSPNYVYCSASNPRLKLLLKNSRLSDDIAFRFSDHGWNEFPLTVEKFLSWVTSLDSKEDTVNLFMNYETFGNLHSKETGILEFLKALPKKVLSTNKITFSLPSELADKYQPIAPLSVPHPISWADEERDVSAWMGNELQKEAFDKLYKLRDKVLSTNDPKILIDWKYLQTSDHFYYMCTKFFIQGSMHSYFNPFNSPYDAFINYMNILSDFEIKVNEALKPKEEPLTEKQKIRKTKKAAIKKEEVIAAKVASKSKKVAKPEKPVKKKSLEKDLALTKESAKASTAKKPKTAAKFAKPTSQKKKVASPSKAKEDKSSPAKAMKTIVKPVKSTIKKKTK
jgi:alpha-amylase